MKGTHIRRDSLAQIMKALGRTTVRERSLIRVLSIAADHDLEPAPLLLALAQEFPGRFGDRLKQFSDKLNDGQHLLDALSTTKGILDDNYIAALRLADQSGKLVDVYEAMLASSSVVADGGVRIASVGSEFFRLLIVTAFAWSAMFFFSIGIMPTIQTMFTDLGLAIPPATQAFMDASRFLPWVVLPMILAMVVYLLIDSRLVFHWFVNRFMPSRFGKPWQPSSVRVRSLLAMIPRLELPVDQALATIIKAPCGVATRRRLQNALARIEQRQEPWESLAKAGLIDRSEARALTASGSPMAAAWILDRLADQRFGKFASRRRRHEALFSIINTVVLAAFAGWMAISVFFVLSELIRGLA